MGRRSARFWSFAALSVAAVLLAPVTASAAPPACNPPSGYVANVQAGETITLPAPPCTDPDGDPVTIHPTQGPSHGTVDPSGDAPIGTRDYTADADAGGLDDVLKFVARANGEDSAEATLTIHIATNHAPVCPAHVDITVPMNGTFVISQSPCTDSDGDPLSFILVDPPDHGVVTGPAPNGSYSYTPEHDYAGADSLTYKAMDASAESNVGTLAITVEEANRAPACPDRAFTVQAGSSIVLPAPVCSDADGDGLTYAVVNGPSHGTFDASRRYTPAGGFVGSDSISYRASDGVLQSNVAIVRITVTRPSGGGGTPPVIKPPVVTPPPPKPDTAPPALGVAALRNFSLAAALKRGVSFALTAGEPGRVVVRLLVNRATARKLGLRGKRAAVVGKLSRPLAAGRTKLTVKLSKKARRKLKNVRSVKLKLEATITDAAGNRRKVVRSIVLKRKP